MFLSSTQIAMLKSAILESVYMVTVSTFITSLAGILLGVLLVTSRPGHILENRLTHWALGALINATRSVPFPIFIVFIIPLTRLIVGSSIGSTAVIVPLTLAAIVFMARLVETSLSEVPPGVIEAAQVVGASNWQIIWHVLLPEARPGLIMAVTITIITLISYSAMAGAVGGGGLGDLAIRYGYQRYQTNIMFITVLILLIFVQFIQYLGDRLVRWVTRL